MVTLANGDRNTGDIEELERGRLSLETNDAGTISFEWDKVATVEAARQFEVVTSDGRHFLGSLGRSSAGSILITTVNDTITLSLSEVTRIHPIGASLWTRLEGSMTSYYTYDRPKTTVDASADYFPGLTDWGRHRLQVNASVRREVWKDVFVALSLYNTFDSAPPSPDAARNDVGVAMSIGWSP